MQNPGARAPEWVLKWLLDLAVSHESGHRSKPYGLLAMTLAAVLALSPLNASVDAAGNVFGIPAGWLQTTVTVVAIIWIIHDIFMVISSWVAVDLWSRLPVDVRAAYLQTGRPDVVTRRRRD